MFYKKSNILAWLIPISIIVSLFVIIVIISLLTNNTNTDEFLEKNVSPVKTDIKQESNTIIQKQEVKHHIKLTFMHDVSGCALNGEIYFDEQFLDNTKYGEYILSEEIYEKYDSPILSLKGLTDECFGNDAGLPIFVSWDISDQSELFENNGSLDLTAIFSPRDPDEAEAMQGFVRPYEVSEYYADFHYTSENLIERLDQIARKGIQYRDDNSMFKAAEYWQTPAETLKRGYGDCEDWALFTLSRMLAYNSSLKCYNTLWDSHMSILCIIGNRFIIYDQGDTKYSTIIPEAFNPDELQENKIALRQMKKNYFEYYGLRNNEQNLYALINDKEIILFDTNEDFIDWAANITKKY